MDGADRAPMDGSSESGATRRHFRRDSSSQQTATSAGIRHRNRRHFHGDSRRSRD
jgi:hypothetical protein